MKYAKSIAALLAAIGVAASTLAAGGPVTLADGLAIAAALAGLLGVYAVPNKVSAPASPAAPKTLSASDFTGPPVVIPTAPPATVLPVGLADPVLGDHVARHERIDPGV